MQKEVKLAYSKVIPFRGFYAITLFGTVIRREKYRNYPLDPVTYNHEGIHICQAEDLCKGFFGYILFYLLYILEWLFKCIISLFTLFKVRAYMSISFEQEAYNNEKDMLYQDKRKKFAWAKYIFKLVWKK